MDPQQRLLLETTYRALENGKLSGEYPGKVLIDWVILAGVPMENAAGSKTSVYIGSFSNDYRLLMQKDTQIPAKHFATGTEAGMLANRLSWFFDLKGPSMQVDTACSSGLTALHLACQGLRAQDADMVSRSY